MTDTAKVGSLFDVGAVEIGLPPIDKVSAIRHSGRRLVERGHVDPAYVDSMVEREETVSTYLGNGVAMPHGTHASKSEVKSTGLVVAQYPDGIAWDVGVAHLVIGLAAVGDDHVHVLAHIAEVLQDEDLARRLWTTPDAAELHGMLDGQSVIAIDEPVSGSIQILGEAGLHARPASLVVEVAKRFDGSIAIAKGDKTARADSIMSVLALGATTLETIDVTIEGEDRAASVAALDEITRILTTAEGDL